MPAKFTPDTNKPVYNELVRLPNTGDWSKILSGSTAAAQPFITEFIARLQGNADMSDLKSYVNTEVGFAPYSTLPVFDLDQ